jgi:hypothetical protein
MSPNSWFSSVTRTPAILLALVIFATNLSSAEWNEKVLYSFQGIPDGSLPVGGIVFDKQGNLYGATQDDGSASCRSANECGTVFQLAPPAKQGDTWTETVLYVFKGNASNDGATPFSGLVIDNLGNIYGTTGYGGTGDCILLGSKLGCGTVYELSPPAQQGWRMDRNRTVQLQRRQGWVSPHRRSGIRQRRQLVWRNRLWWRQRHDV